MFKWVGQKFLHLLPRRKKETEYAKCNLKFPLPKKVIILRVFKKKKPSNSIEQIILSHFHSQSGQRTTENQQQSGVNVNTAFYKRNNWGLCLFTTLKGNSVWSWSDELLTGVLETRTSTSGVRENRALMRDDLPTLLLPIKHTWKTPTGSQLQICVL